MARKSKRNLILESAAQIVTESGSDALTLDAVAAHSGVSKGGLLYHFNNKTALIEGLVDYANQRYRENVAHYEAVSEETAGRWTTAFINATQEKREENARITSGVLAAQGLNPKLLKPLQETYAEWQTQIEADGLEQIDATIIRLAVDGLWLSEIFGLDALDLETRDAVLERLKMYVERAKKSQQ